MKKLYMLSFSLLTLFSQSFSLVARHVNALDCRDINYRIEKHLQLINTLNTLSKRGILRSEIIKSKKSACSNCSHELIKLCMKKMEQDTCLDPVLETWKLFNSSYSEIDTELFLQEFSSMVCAVSREYVSALSSLPINIRKQKENKLDESSSLSLEGENAPILLSTVSLQE
ncbi:MAG: hypothetical protein M1114_02180, partial [Candidatus Dependentiae bacterium]|nr:hypothetical protein [Candidatus Dependentiae bacterium]